MICHLAASTPNELGAVGSLCSTLEYYSSHLVVAWQSLPSPGRNRKRGTRIGMRLRCVAKCVSGYGDGVLVGKFNQFGQRVPQPFRTHGNEYRIRQR
jgi:hypothetical protein